MVGMTEQKKNFFLGRIVPIPSLATLPQIWTRQKKEMAVENCVKKLFNAKLHR